MLSHDINYIFDCLPFPVQFSFAGHQGSSQSDLCTSTGSAPLNFRPVDGYRKGRATPICIWNPAQSGSSDMLHVGLEHVGLLHAILHML